jgi:dihydroxy-acid dehydratase
VPLLADVKPFGKYGMAHLIRFGGIRPMMKLLLDRGMLHGDCLTVTGETMAESLKNVAPYPSYPDQQDVIRPWDQPIKKETHLRILHGNLAPGGAVGKITGKEGVTSRARPRSTKARRTRCRAFSAVMSARATSS